MKVTRLTILARGLANRCPNCGGRTLFREGTLFTINAECPRCGLRIERDEGFFLGSITLNYSVTLACFVAPVMLLDYYDVIGNTLALTLAIAGSVLFPALFYRSSRSWWLMVYYYFLPQHLPANQSPAGTQDDENV
jgi:uncharacterized protein (DUF983 family)